MKHISSALLLSTLAGLSLGVAPTAHAQSTTRFSTVEFKDTTLSDALEMIFQAANNPAHTIDPSASEVPIGSITLQNLQWDNALRTLANQNNFKVSRGADGSYLVEPREPILEDGGIEGGRSGSSDPRFRGGSGSSDPRFRGGAGNGPANPFGGRGTTSRPGTRGGVNFQMLPSMRSSAQTIPRIGGGTGTNATTEEKPIVPIPVLHIYAGGIAQLFNNSSIIPTLPFVSPASGGGQGGGGQGGFGGGGFGGGQGGFGGGGFGGGQGGFGGSGFGGGQGGFGGGGFGGQQGGFGGGGFGGQQGGFGGGGFGGQQGGFGGGGFGGQQGGFGGGGFGGQQGGFGGGGFGF